MNKETKNEVATTESKVIAAYAVKDTGLMDAMKSEMDGLVPKFERIKIPSGGGTAFEIPGENGETEPKKSFEAVIVFHHPVSAWYASKDVTEGERPNCGSMDGKFGIDTETGEVCDCSTCDKHKFGSGENGGMACKQKRRVFIMFEGEMLPRLISIPTGSLGNFSQYVMQLLTKGKKSSGVVTKFALKEAKNTKGTKYSQVVFSVVRGLDAAEQASIDSTAEWIRIISGKVDLTEDVETVE